jgi:hypothetical protein
MHSYDTDQVAKWGVVSWMVNEGDAPLVDMVFNASSDMVDYNLSIIFESQDSSNNYLRIQVLLLPKELVQYIVNLIHEGSSFQEIVYFVVV